MDPLFFPRKGLRLDRPDAWTAKRRRGVVRLRSGDGRIAVSVATRPQPLGARGARQAAEETVGRAFEAVRVVRRRRSTLGGGPARAVELVARGRGGALVDLLVIGGRSRWRSYAVTTVSLRPVADDALRQLRVVLDSIGFVEPAA